MRLSLPGAGTTLIRIESGCPSGVDRVRSQETTTWRESAAREMADVTFVASERFGRA
jgi:hypothetical protein